MKKLLLWCADHFVGTCMTLLVLSSAGAYAATSYDVNNLPTMFLNAGITATQTSGITVAAPIVNGTAITFPTKSGGVLRLQSSGRTEDIYYASATVNSTTKVITLSGVIRDLCIAQFKTFVGCNNGFVFAKGATVKLNNDARLYNLKLNFDRVNLLTGSGQIAGTGTGQSIIDLPCITSSQRDNMTNVSDGQIICNSTLGTFQYRSANTWIGFGSGSTNNATETTAGKIQIGTLDALKNRTVTGSTNAKNVLGFQWIVKNGTGTVSSGRIPQLNHQGFIGISLGGTASGSYVQSGVLVGNGLQSFNSVLPGSNGNLLKSNGQEWVTGSGTTTSAVKAINFAITSQTGSSMSGTHYFTGSYVIPANNLVSGVAYEFEGTIRTTTDSGRTYTPCVEVGGTKINLGNLTVAATNKFINVKAKVFGTASAGASVPVMYEASFLAGTSTGTTSIVVGSTDLATNGALTLRLCGTFANSNAALSANARGQIYRKISSSEF